MTRTRRNSPLHPTPRTGFTLIELLIVLAIIGLLAAILFPAFRSAQERSAQASCATNLKQIYQAVELYRQDEKVYPSSLAFLLPAETNIDGGSAGGDPNTGGTGFFKGGSDALVCPDDDTDASLIRSSYGDISYDITAGDKTNMSRYLWNYWGYRAVDGTCTDTDASGCAGTAFQADDAAYVAQFQAYATATPADRRWLANPDAAFDATNNPVSPAKLPRLANRFAPTSTIITHCVYHRLPTASGKLAFPSDITNADSRGALARDIILRRDGSARVLDVSKFHTDNNWAKQNF